MDFCRMSWLLLLSWQLLVIPFAAAAPNFVIMFMDDVSTLIITFVEFESLYYNTIYHLLEVLELGFVHISKLIVKIKWNWYQENL